MAMHASSPSDDEVPPVAAAVPEVPPELTLPAPAATGAVPFAESSSPEPQAVVDTSTSVAERTQKSAERDNGTRTHITSADGGSLANF